MLKGKISLGEIVQVAAHVPEMGGCFAVVSEVKSWGCEAYIMNYGGRSPDVMPEIWVRLQWSDMAPTGGRTVLAGTENPPQASTAPLLERPIARYLLNRHAGGNI